MSADGAAIDEDDVREINRHLKRDKTTRLAAAGYLLAAY